MRRILQDTPLAPIRTQLPLLQLFVSQPRKCSHSDSHSVLIHSYSHSHSHSHYQYHYHYHYHNNTHYHYHFQYHYHYYNVQFLTSFCALFCSCFLSSKTPPNHFNLHAVPESAQALQCLEQQ